jgi:hypothetical protein
VAKLAAREAAAGRLEEAALMVVARVILGAM